MVEVSCNAHTDLVEIQGYLRPFSHQQGGEYQGHYVVKFLLYRIADSLWRPVERGKRYPSFLLKRSEVPGASEKGSVFIMWCSGRLAVEKPPSWMK